MNSVRETDALELINGLGAGSVDMAIIAPPIDLNPMPVFRALRRVLMETGIAWYITEDDYREPFISGVPWRRALLLGAMDGWQLVMDCVLVKTKSINNTHRRPQPIHDYVFMFSRSQGYRYFDMGVISRSVWRIDNSPHEDGYGFHQTPEELVEILIRMTCPKDGVVLDPFMGTGTTAVVAERLGRQWIGGDSDAAACEIAERRISNG
jgi:hypothetical protein